jgi:hypothetical protein
MTAGFGGDEGNARQVTHEAEWRTFHSHDTKKATIGVSVAFWLSR